MDRSPARRCRSFARSLVLCAAIALVLPTMSSAASPPAYVAHFENEAPFYLAPGMTTYMTTTYADCAQLAMNVTSPGYTGNPYFSWSPGACDWMQDSARLTAGAGASSYWKARKPIWAGINGNSRVGNLGRVARAQLSNYRVPVYGYARGSWTMGTRSWFFTTDISQDSYLRTHGYERQATAPGVSATGATSGVRFWAWATKADVNMVPVEDWYCGGSVDAHMYAVRPGYFYPYSVPSYCSNQGVKFWVYWGVEEWQSLGLVPPSMYPGRGGDPLRCFHC